MVICCEVFEHTPDWRELLCVAKKWLRLQGRIVITAAGPGRDAHSGIDGGELKPGEWYKTITQRELYVAIRAAGLWVISLSGNEYWRDTYATAQLFGAND
jgi:hypothetical protein